MKKIIAVDREKKFLFAPLNGKTAEEILSGPQKSLRRQNSLVLVENYHSTNRHFWIRSRAIFRTYWLIGRGWKILGSLFFLPGFLGDFLYKQIAARRHQFKFKFPDYPGPKSRFLP